MDKTRRSLILGASTLPLVGLSACGGGGGNETGSATAAGGQVQPQATGSTGSTNFRVAIYNPGFVDPVFYDPKGGRYIFPTTGKNHACLNGSTMWVCITESISGYHRNVQLQLNGFSLSTNRTFQAGTDIVLGNLTVNGDDGTHYDWEVQTTGSVASSSISSSTTNGITSGSFTLTFTNLLISKTPASKLQNNSVQTANMQLQGQVTVPFQVETAAWM